MSEVNNCNGNRGLPEILHSVQDDVNYSDGRKSNQLFMIIPGTFYGDKTREGTALEFMLRYWSVVMTYRMEKPAAG